MRKKNYPLSKSSNGQNLRPDISWLFNKLIGHWSVILKKWVDFQNLSGAKANLFLFIR